MGPCAFKHKGFLEGYYLVLRLTIQPYLPACLFIRACTISSYVPVYPSLNPILGPEEAC